MIRARALFLFSLVLGLLASWPGHAARDAAFMAPGAVTSGPARSDESVTVEPKSEMDVGETPINVGRRATFFFVNGTNLPIDIESVKANGDSNVRAEIVADDCSKEGKIQASSRCSVTVELTPAGSGSWTGEVLLTHNAPGRIARARISGKTSGAGAGGRETGLALSAKDMKPVDFGEVEAGRGKAVRTALMVNDSNEPITVLSIEVIAPENGLERLEQGCLPDMDLKPGESCPVTMLWKPETKGLISTDLIIRHSGRLGFAVIPVRGTAKETAVKNADPLGKGAGAPAASSGASSAKIPLSPTAEEMEKALSGQVPQVSAENIPDSALNGAGGAKKSSGGDGAIHLIGTVGNRAVIYMPDGTTSVVAIGDEIPLPDGATAKLTNVMAKQAEVFIDGKKKTLNLETVAALTAKAAESLKSAKSKPQKGSDDPRKSQSSAPIVPSSVGK